MKIFCLIPAYNERGNLEKLTFLITKAFRNENISYKILFVIQGNDGSKEIVEKLKKEYKPIDYIYYPLPLGIGKAYKKGFENIDKTFPFILTMDADLNHDPEELKHFIHTLKKHKLDLCIGSRFIKGGSFYEQRIWKKIASHFLNSLIPRLYQIPVHDISSGYRLVKRSIIENVSPKLREKGYPSYMEFMILAKKTGAKIGEIPIRYIPRVWGKSKMGKLKTAIDYLFFLLRLPFIS